MNTARRGFSIRTFLADGTPDSLQLIEHSQWLGRGTVIPRVSLANHTSRPELNAAGVYMLVGVNPHTGCERISIGQTSTLRDDLPDLERREYWTRMIVFSAEGQRLHRSQIDYVESRLVELARETLAAEVENDETPRSPDMIESDRADADYFVDQVVLICPTIGVHAFDAIPRMPQGGEILRLTGSGVNANGYDAATKFVVKSGSVGSRAEGEGCPGYLLDLRRSLVDRGVVTEEGKQLRFNKSYAFASSEQAAQVLTGDSGADMSWRPAGSTEPDEDAPAKAPGRTEKANGPSVNVKPIRAKAQAAS